MKEDGIRKKIETYEYHTRGLSKLNWCNVIADNLNIDEDKKIVTCDITIQQENESHTYNGCEYKFSLLKLI